MKHKKISKEKYIALFCRDKRIRGRSAIYVSPEVHRRLKRISALFRFEHYTSLSSLADRILDHHIEAYGALLTQLKEEADNRFLNGSGYSTNNEDFDEDPEESD